MTKRTTRQLNISMPIHIHKRIVEYAEREGRSISNAVARLVEQALDQEDEK